MTTLHNCNYCHNSFHFLYVKTLPLMKGIKVKSFKETPQSSSGKTWLALWLLCTDSFLPLHINLNSSSVYLSPHCLIFPLFQILWRSFPEIPVWISTTIWYHQQLSAFPFGVIKTLNKPDLGSNPWGSPWTSGCSQAIFSCYFPS